MTLTNRIGLVLEIMVVHNLLLKIMFNTNIYNICVTVLNAHGDSDVKKAITHTNTIPFENGASPIQGVRSLITTEFTEVFIGTQAW